MKPTTPGERPPGVDEGTNTPKKTGSDATAPDALYNADTSVIGVYLVDEDALECQRCHREAAARDGGAPGETISENELSVGDDWRCRACRTDLRTCARIQRLEEALEKAVSAIAHQHDELSRMRKHLRKL